MAIPGWPFWSGRGWDGVSGTTSSSSSTRSECSSFIGSLDAELAAELTELFEAAGLQLGEVPALVALVALARKRPREDRRVAAGRVNCSADPGTRGAAPGGAGLHRRVCVGAGRGAGSGFRRSLSTCNLDQKGIWVASVANGRASTGPRGSVLLSSGGRAGG